MKPPLVRSALVTTIIVIERSKITILEVPRIEKIVLKLGTHYCGTLGLIVERAGIFYLPIGLKHAKSVFAITSIIVTGNPGISSPSIIKTVSVITFTISVVVPTRRKVLYTRLDSLKSLLAFVVEFTSPGVRTSTTAAYTFATNLFTIGVDTQPISPLVPTKQNVKSYSVIKNANIGIIATVLPSFVLTFTLSIVVLISVVGVVLILNTNRGDAENRVNNTTGNIELHKLHIVGSLDTRVQFTDTGTEIVTTTTFVRTLPGRPPPLQPPSAGVIDNPRPTQTRVPPTNIPPFLNVKLQRRTVLSPHFCLKSPVLQPPLLTRPKVSLVATLSDALLRELTIPNLTTIVREPPLCGTTTILHSLQLSLWPDRILHPLSSLISRFKIKLRQNSLGLDPFEGRPLSLKSSKADKVILPTHTPTLPIPFSSNVSTNLPQPEIEVPNYFSNTPENTSMALRPATSRRHYGLSARFSPLKELIPKQLSVSKRS